jgi:hypothetical protein
MAIAIAAVVTIVATVTVTITPINPMATAIVTILDTRFWTIVPMATLDTALMTMAIVTLPGLMLADTVLAGLADVMPTATLMTTPCLGVRSPN